MKKQMRIAKNEIPNRAVGMLTFHPNEEPEIQQGLAICVES